MSRRTDIVSIGLSLSLALALFVHVLPTERPSASKPETVTPPTPLLKAVRISVATLDLPPPPPPLTTLPSPAQSTVKAAVVRPLKPAGPAVAKTTVSPLKPSIDPPVSPPLEPAGPAVAKTTVSPLKPSIDPPVSPPQKVATLKPSSKTQSLQKSTNVKPLKPTDIPQAEPADAEIAVADEKKSSRREAERKIAPQPANAMAQKKAPTVGQSQTSPLIAVGRPLLRLLEHGDGPRIDISWPTDPHERSALFDTFERCYGMVVALVAESGDLYSDRSSAAPWEINLDYYSGFVRQSGRLSTPRERDWSRRIVQRHPSAAGKLPVRVFPRQTDALLMGGLHELLAGSYRSTKSITARYAHSAQSVTIVGISADGLNIPGRIDLSAAARRSCLGSHATSGRHS